MSQQEDVQTGPLIKQIVASRNRVFVEADSPSPLMGFPGALGLDLRNHREHFPAIMARIEQQLNARKAAGRLGTWPVSRSGR